MLNSLWKNSLFNRNILYCKFLRFKTFYISFENLIGTFCIVNILFAFIFKSKALYLIGTFCIVNEEKKFYIVAGVINLIGTFCIVNIRLWYIVIIT